MTYNSFNIGDSLPTIMRSISQEVIDQYAEASGDFNPIHIDQLFAKNSPLVQIPIIAISSKSG